MINYVKLCFMNLNLNILLCFISYNNPLKLLKVCAIGLVLIMSIDHSYN